MKTIKFAIFPHSFIDVITNSSTELFVCEKGKTLRQVNDILSTLNPTHSLDARYPKIDEIGFLRYGKLIKKEKRGDRDYEEDLIIGTPIRISDESDESWDRITEDGCIIVERNNNNPYELFESIRTLLNAKQFSN